MSESTRWHWLVLALHGGPAVCVPAGKRAETPDVSAREKRRAPRPLTEIESTLRELDLLARRGTGRSNPKYEDAYESAWPLEKPDAELLTYLIFEAEYVGKAGLGVPIKKLLRAPIFPRLFEKGKAATETSALQRVSSLRMALKKRAGNPVGINPITREAGSCIALNARVLRCDWFEVLGAELSAGESDDAYGRAHAYLMAERAFVQSLTRTPRRTLTDARVTPPGFMDKVIAKRWEMRYAYLKALLEIDHTDTMVTDYRLYRELARSDPPSFRSATGEVLIPCRDEFLQTSHQSVEAALDRLGSITMPGGETLAVAADPKPPGPRLGTADEELRSVTRKRDRRQARLEAALVAPPSSDGAPAAEDEAVPEITISWKDFDVLIEFLHQTLVEISFLPQVLVSVGRGGSVVGAALSERLPCRSVGFVAIDRYIYKGNRSSGSPYIGGHELPNRRACAVLVCDDIVASGQTVRDVIDDVIRPEYPHAEIVVASLVLNTEARSDRRPGVTWLSGLEVEGPGTRPIKVNFSWKTHPDAAHIIPAEDVTRTSPTQRRS
jgi:hypoxanthine phosphoribosyltransferase